MLTHRKLYRVRWIADFFTLWHLIVDIVTSIPCVLCADCGRQLHPLNCFRRLALPCKSIWSKCFPSQLLYSLGFCFRSYQADCSTNNILLNDDPIEKVWVLTPYTDSGHGAITFFLHKKKQGSYHFCDDKLLGYESTRCIQNYRWLSTRNVHRHMASEMSRN